MASRGIAFIGVYIMGIGFTIERDRALQLIHYDGRNRNVLSPFLNGEDINSRPDISASRWVINFGSLSEGEASTYRECFEHVSREVKPYRLSQNNEWARRHWWQFFRQRPELHAAIAGLERVVVITLHTKTVMPVMVPTGQVFSHALGVFATDDTAMLALLSSGAHYWWTVNRGSTLGSGTRYTPTDVFETLPLPELTEEMRVLGDRLDTYRRELMLRRQSGLTATYNLVNDPACRDDDIEELRAIHRAIDEAVCRAYGWDDLLAAGLEHGFHDLGRETRYTVGPAVLQEMVDRLLELNHARYAEEVAAGLHDRKGTRRRVPKQGVLFETGASAPQPAPEEATS